MRHLLLFSALFASVALAFVPAAAAAQTIIVIDYGGELTPPNAPPAAVEQPAPPVFTAPPASTPEVPPIDPELAAPAPQAFALTEPTIGRGGRIGLELLGAGAGIGMSVAMAFGMHQATGGCYYADTPGYYYDEYSDEYYYDYYDYGYDPLECAGSAIMVGALSLPPTTTLGVWGAGRAAGGRGSFWATLVGNIAGTSIGAGVGFLAALNEYDYDFDATWIVLAMPVGSVLGSILAFELDHSRRTRRLRRRAAQGLEAAREPGLQVVPTVSASADGAIFGAAGAF